MSQKGFAHFFIILAVFSILGSGVAFYTYSYRSISQNPQESVKISPIPSPLPQDPTYKNSDLGVSFSYPKDLEIIEESEEEYSIRVNGNFRKNFSGYMQYEPPTVLGSVLVKNQNEELKGQFDDSPFSIWVFDNSMALDALQWYANYWYYPFVWGNFSEKISGKYAPTKEATISGKLANFSVIDYQPNKPQFTYIKSKNKMYLLRIPQNLNQQIPQQILSTLKIDD